MEHLRWVRRCVGVFRWTRIFYSGYYCCRASIIFFFFVGFLPYHLHLHLLGLIPCI